MTFHLIPWLQVAGEFGMGLSETIRVTADGCERLCDLERKLFLR
jgi:Xaa-Pro aminopeptidase